MNLQDDDFTLFQLPHRMAQDKAMLDERWKALQRQAHPDKFVAQGAAAQRVAMQWSVRINEAYQRLKDPLKRAAYLCELHGAPIDAESNTTMPSQFLLQQMQWREALDEAGSPAALQVLAGQVQTARQQTMASIEQAIDAQHDHAHAATLVRALMFVEKFAQDVRQHQLRMQPPVG